MLASVRTMPMPAGLLPFHFYDEIHINTSGGIDSTACLLMILHLGAPKERMLFVHQRIDGPPTNPVFFDYEETEEHLNYLRDFFQIPLEVIWDDEGLLQRIKDRGMFPDSSNRFCTSYGKRDVYNKFVRNRGGQKNILCITGERAEESKKRSTYPAFLIHPTTAPTLGRLVHWFRPVLHLTKNEVRAMLREAGVKEHPCYQIVSRCSCKFCIFLSPSEMKAVAKAYPEPFAQLKELEVKMGHTMKYIGKRQVPLCEFIDEHAPYENVPLLF